jgi:hypothetical protein
MLLDEYFETSVILNYFQNDTYGTQGFKTPKFYLWYIAEVEFKDVNISDYLIQKGVAKTTKF